MNIKINSVQDWLFLVRQADWSVARLAKLNRINERTLRRYFLKNIGDTPKLWITEQRLKLAIKLLKHGLSAKETAYQLGYRHYETFSRDFKKWHGQSPLHIKRPPPLQLIL